jgi:hypothetical protein
MTGYRKRSAAPLATHDAIMRRILVLLSLTLFLAATPQFAQAQSCGANARFSHFEEHGEVTKLICNCNPGYRKQDNACVKSEILRPATAREVRGLRAQCVHDEGKRLERNLKACERSMLSCLINRGNSKSVAICATTILIGMADPTKAAALAALAVCGLELPEASEAVQGCRREADCKTEKTKLHDGRVAACKRD